MIVMTISLQRSSYTVEFLIFVPWADRLRHTGAAFLFHVQPSLNTNTVQLLLVVSKKVVNSLLAISCAVSLWKQASALWTEINSWSAIWILGVMSLTNQLVWSFPVSSKWSSSAYTTLSPNECRCHTGWRSTVINSNSVNFILTSILLPEKEQLLHLKKNKKWLSGETWLLNGRRVPHFPFHSCYWWTLQYIIWFKKAPILPF